MFKKKQDSDKILQDTIYGTGGIPKPEPGAVTVGKTKKRRNEQNLFQRIMNPRKVVREEHKEKKPGFFSTLFGGPRFKRRKGKGLDGF
jgi:hypothetical protein